MEILEINLGKSKDVTKSINKNMYGTWELGSPAKYYYLAK